MEHETGLQLPVGCRAWAAPWTQHSKLLWCHHGPAVPHPTIPSSGNLAAPVHAAAGHLGLPGCAAAGHRRPAMCPGSQAAWPARGLQQQRCNHCSAMCPGSQTAWPARGLQQRRSKHPPAHHILALDLVWLAVDKLGLHLNSLHRDSRGRVVRWQMLGQACCLADMYLGSCPCHLSSSTQDRPARVWQEAEACMVIAYPTATPCLRPSCAPRGQPPTWLVPLSAVNHSLLCFPSTQLPRTPLSSTQLLWRQAGGHGPGWCPHHQSCTGP